MSSPPSDDARTSNRDSVWHPAREWLEEDEEEDSDYIPPRPGSEDEDDDDDGWEDAEDNGAEEMGADVSDGEFPPWVK